jgi:molecular chaperone DnaK (HSP70)
MKNGRRFINCRFLSWSPRIPLNRGRVLPSFLYQCTRDETTAKSFALPWGEDSSFAVGHGARALSAEFPERTTRSRESRGLGTVRLIATNRSYPGRLPSSVTKISPVTASQRYLEHLIAAWHQAFPDAPIADQRVVLTVPASFDASARELTREAALAAGLPKDFVLLEEPQAATYAWLNAVGDRWRKMLKVGDRMLVCDIGGGTTDLTLVEVAEEDGQLTLATCGGGKPPARWRRQHGPGARALRRAVVPGEGTES